MYMYMYMPYRSRIEALYTLNPPPVVSFSSDLGRAGGLRVGQGENGGSKRALDEGVLKGL